MKDKCFRISAPGLGEQMCVIAARASLLLPALNITFMIRLVMNNKAGDETTGCIWQDSDHNKPYLLHCLIC